MANKALAHKWIRTTSCQISRNKKKTEKLQKDSKNFSKIPGRQSTRRQLRFLREHSSSDHARRHCAGVKIFNPEALMAKNVVTNKQDFG